MYKIQSKIQMVQSSDCPRNHSMLWVICIGSFYSKVSDTAQSSEADQRFQRIHQRLVHLVLHTITMKMSSLQLTLSILKPHVVKNPFAIERIIRIIQENDLEIVKRSTVQMTKSLAARFYAEHLGKFFYNRLETSMCRFVCYESLAPWT